MRGSSTWHDIAAARAVRAVWALCLLAPAVPAVGAETPAGCDFACRMAEANEASLVMLHEQHLLKRPLAAALASALRAVEAEQAAPGARRPSNYLDVERRLIEMLGPDASRLHTGRSRQDLHETVRRMLMRAELHATLDALLGARTALLDLAERHVDTIIPAYTHGVQAQPTTLAHYLLAFSAALGRDADRLRELHGRLNQSPLGAAALGTSGYAIDRARLAALLGFDRPVENSFDATLLSPADVKIEFAGVLANSAVHVGQFAQDLHAQYREARPWMLVDAATTDVSSLMPQKRNPRPVDRLRSRASEVVAGAEAVTLVAHNTHTGMNDYRETEPLFAVTEAAAAMYRAWSRLLEGLGVSPEAALAVVEADYSTTTEIADMLQREADVPFRTAHEYASALTDHGRSLGRKPVDLSDEELNAVYVGVAGSELPVRATAVREAMDPARMIATRRGLGGPQPAESRRMLAAQRLETDSARAWLEARRQALAAATAERRRAVEALMR